MRSLVSTIWGGGILALLLGAVLQGQGGTIAASIPKSRSGSELLHTFWSLRSIARPHVPQISGGNKTWIRTPIDAFLLAKLSAKRISPPPPAGRATLLSRITFDLTGLPPTPDELNTFLTDASPDAYSRVVDRLLASELYGERWGRHWLDVVRYADTGGFEKDELYPNAWKYRDYVIRSLNRDKPFDRFLQEQVAGDELWPGNEEAAAATALYCIGPVLTESAMVSNQLECEWLMDSADLTGAAFLGITVGCARCHNHKYYPITQTDYYALQAVFAASDRPFPREVRLRRIKALNGLVADTPLPKELETDPRCTVVTEDQVGFRLFHRASPLPVHRLGRGEVGKPLELTAPAIPSALLATTAKPDFSATPPGMRRAILARWLTSRQNPLVARVFVNRVWGWHFGRGLVGTPNDFGTQGEPPTFPELLDWLAQDFMDHGWSVKRLHRQILLSSVYRANSVAYAGIGMKADPTDKFLWHYPRHRLEGEAIRDSMLACAGTLNPRMYGVAVVPPLDHEELAGVFGAAEKWPVTKEVSEHSRRSVYLLERRSFVYPLIAAFDPPEVMTSCPRRLQTIVPTQALTLLNSPLARQQAAAFAQRLLQKYGDTHEAAVRNAWLSAFGRPITVLEEQRALEFLRKERALAAVAAVSLKNNTLSGHSVSASPDEQALTALCLALFNANEFAYID